MDISDRVLLFYSIGFDASVGQIFLPLISGAAVVAMDRFTLLDNKRFGSYLFNRCITHLDSVPSVLGEIKNEDARRLKRIISGGEECPCSPGRTLYIHL